MEDTLIKTESPRIRPDTVAGFSRALRSEEMVINMGPQHPSTHGVLRLELVVNGEVVVDVIPHIGYLHRCFEKHCEHMTNYQQVIPYADRMDYVAAMSNELGYVVAVEKLLNIKVPERVEYIRVIMAEFSRIVSHLIAIGTYGMDIGAFTPFLYCMRDREHVLDIFERTCGARLLYNYMWIGGLSHDVPADFTEKVKAFCKYFRPNIKELNDLLSYNKIFIEQAVDKMPAGDVQSAIPKRIRPNPGEVYVRTETPKGELGYYIISDGTASPFRVKVKAPCFVNLSALPAMCRGAMIADVVAILGSIDIVLGEVDR